MGIIKRRAEEGASCFTFRPPTSDSRHGEFKRLNQLTAPTNEISDFGHSPEEHLQQHHELQILFQISSALQSSPRLEDVLQRALTAILSTLRLKMGAIYLVKDIAEEQWLLELAAHYGFPSSVVNAIQAITVPPEVMSRFGYHKMVHWVPVSRLFFAQLRERMHAADVNEVICIPLKNQHNVLGLMYVTNEGHLQVRPERSEFLTAIGNQLGVAIENAQLFESIERAKSELEISFDAIQHSFFLVDNQLRIFRVNRTCEMVYGKRKDLVGKKYTRVLYGQDQPPPECPIWACLWGGQPVQREGPHPRWGGYYHYYAFPVLNTYGDVERVVYYEKDVTEERKLEHRLHQTERLKALGTLAAGIAHEIRNPLATINFNTQMLQRELTLDDTQQQMFEDVVQQIKKIDRIVQQVLSFAKPREPQFLPYHLNEIVDYCHDLVKAHLRKTNMEAVLELDKEIPMLVVDFNQISQVIINLMINAIEAMPDGGLLTIRTRFQEEPAAVVLEVADTGQGILEEDRDRIFDPFFTRKSEGTGLGLSISRQILEKHGAFIELDSETGAGSTFRIIFPIASG
jgi:two-component system, NtrC family, sensor kinase